MKKEEIIDLCLDEIRTGKSTLEDCLARYPQLSDELRPLLEITTSIEEHRVTLSPEFKRRARNRLLGGYTTSATPHQTKRTV